MENESEKFGANETVLISLMNRFYEFTAHFEVALLC